MIFAKQPLLLYLRGINTDTKKLLVKVFAWEITTWNDESLGLGSHFRKRMLQNDLFLKAALASSMNPACGLNSTNADLKPNLKPWTID